MKSANKYKKLIRILDILFTLVLFYSIGFFIAVMLSDLPDKFVNISLWLVGIPAFLMIVLYSYLRITEDNESS